MIRIEKRIQFVVLILKIGRCKLFHEKANFWLQLLMRVMTVMTFWRETWEFWRLWQNGVFHTVWAQPIRVQSTLSTTLRYLLNTLACLTIFSFYTHRRDLITSCSLNYFQFLYTPARLTHPARLLKSNKWGKILPFSILKLQINQVWWSDIW